MDPAGHGSASMATVPGRRNDTFGERKAEADDPDTQREELRPLTVSIPIEFVDHQENSPTPLPLGESPGRSLDSPAAAFVSVHAAWRSLVEAGVHIEELRARRPVTDSRMKGMTIASGMAAVAGLVISTLPELSAAGHLGPDSIDLQLARGLGGGVGGVGVLGGLTIALELATWCHAFRQANAEHARCAAVLRAALQREALQAMPQSVNEQTRQITGAENRVPGDLHLLLPLPSLSPSHSVGSMQSPRSLGAAQFLLHMPEASLSASADEEQTSEVSPASKPQPPAS
jgi:hypothetical protein